MQSDTFSEFIAKSEMLGSEWIFRGLRESEKLETTLERETNKKIYSFQEYMRLLQRCVPEVEAYTGRDWDQVGRDVPLTFHNLGSNPKLADFMIYMRHHGFPSPIMDWTRSPYIAAYFAFSKPLIDDDTGKVVAYHRQTKATGHWNSEARIEVLDPLVVADKRHHTQQSVYTVCCETDEINDVFCSYQKIDASQFIEFKLGNKRNEVLKRLDKMNINAHTLFHNEDGLAMSLGLRLFSN